jgi:hypothetical protein
MPKHPSVSGKDTVKALSKVGFRLRRQVGSHMILKENQMERGWQFQTTMNCQKAH